MPACLGWGKGERLGLVGGEECGEARSPTTHQQGGLSILHCSYGKNSMYVLATYAVSSLGGGWPR